ncbi:hypothetical protein VSS37_16365 [Candidatus Thiothrix sp. Deng01]|uniref:Adenylate cyclase n=1 Tax=Candidatus Thiothrix phosphatis TaxID=3112415 RepID=A0ABU6D0H3_9GAMM|nr:hypothetical protein [Candidatus Thiothrix sp. Deng01]MEB4592561.1 hypothetical protein [Candidatus Thiothrix sp. Deng01]
MVDKDNIRLELKRLLTSRIFENKKQASNFLAYIIAEKLAGRGDKITQYGIAVEALGRSTDYCPTENPAVRVEAGRVRKLLEEYYATEGRGSTLHIQLPVGSYEPVFKELVTQPEHQRQEPLLELDVKSIQSVGPRIYISCQDPAGIPDNATRNLVYNLISGLPVALGRLHEVRIALADHASLPIGQDELEYARVQHRAEFILRSSVQKDGRTFTVRQTLLHARTGETVWSSDFALPLLYSPKQLDRIYTHLVQEAFSLNQGVALAYWSRYWRGQATIPAHYRVLATHVHFVQEDLSRNSFQAFLQACEERTQLYHDDALAYLHFAILCLYALLLNVPGKAGVLGRWRQLCLQALELNPDNALAHCIFALECQHRGDTEITEVEIQTARQSSAFDATCSRLLAVGLCALRNWELANVILKEAIDQESSFPDPFRSIPCLHYFRQGKFIRMAGTQTGFQSLGGWATFGVLAGHCRSGDCRSCVQRISQTIDDAYLSAHDSPLLGEHTPQ